MFSYWQIRQIHLDVKMDGCDVMVSEGQSWRHEASLSDFTLRGSRGQRVRGRDNNGFIFSRENYFKKWLISTETNQNLGLWKIKLRVSFSPLGPTLKSHSIHWKPLLLLALQIPTGWRWMNHLTGQQEVLTVTGGSSKCLLYTPDNNTYY